MAWKINNAGTILPHAKCPHKGDDRRKCLIVENEYGDPGMCRKKNCPIKEVPDARPSI